MSDELLFSGENRKKELRRLKRLYDDVASVAQLGHAAAYRSEPPMRLALIEAERGLGKTRLAMELYRHLASTCDPENYWPDLATRNGDFWEVMPRAEAFDYSRPIPFLWWGLSVSQGASVGSTLLGSLPDLLPHLLSARLAARRRSSGRELLIEAADLAAELKMPAIEAVLDIAGLGTMKRLAEAALKVGKVLMRHQGRTEADEDAEEKIETLTEGVLSDLSATFSPKSRDFSGVPLVVFIDDAQFADDDRGVAELLSKLSERARSERWPLLLVITHWSRQLQDWYGRDQKLHKQSEVAQVIRRFFKLEATTELPDTSHSQINVLHRIDLNEPVEDLDRALRAKFPGLADADIAGIVEKSGGNPRKLDQICARMDRKPRWFEGHELTAGLTEEGREHVMALADLPIEEVVLERFRDTPAVVRRSLVLASLFGNRFVCEMVDRFAQEQFAHQARGSLETSERNYRFLRGVIDRSRDDIGQFNERLFLDAATEYREAGIARLELKPWPEDASLFEALDRMLNEAVHNVQMREALSRDDEAEVLSFAARRMRVSGRRAAGLALALLATSRWARANLEGALDAAASFSDGCPDAWGAEDVPEGTMRKVALILYGKANVAGATKIYRSLVHHFGEQFTHTPKIPIARSLFRAQVTLAFLEQRAGREEASGLTYRAAAKNYRGLFQNNSGMPPPLPSPVDDITSFRVVIPNGWTNREIVRRVLELDNLTGITADVPLEGTLAPGSYVIERGSDRNSLINEMQRRQTAIVATEWQDRSPECPVKDENEAIILASIVEKENAAHEDFPAAARVLLNRLGNGMKLQSDAALLYGLSGGYSRLGRPFLRADLVTPTPYNTYAHKALPPTPICNPGLEAIRAVLHPEPSRALWSAPFGVGGCRFSDTFEQHNFEVSVSRSWYYWSSKHPDAQDL